jgi:hypothetical protein
MLQEVVDRNSHQRSGKVLLFLSLLLGVAAILSLPQSEQDDSATTMAFASQPVRNRMSSFFSTPVARPMAPIVPNQVRTYAVVDDMFPNPDEIVDNRVEAKAIKWVMKKRPKKRSPSQRARVAPPPTDYGPPPPEFEIISGGYTPPEKPKA